jgi:hypothetical protein
MPNTRHREKFAIGFFDDDESGVPHNMADAGDLERRRKVQDDAV